MVSVPACAVLVAMPHRRADERVELDQRAEALAALALLGPVAAAALADALAGGGTAPPGGQQQRRPSTVSSFRSWRSTAEDAAEGRRQRVAEALAPLGPTA